MDNVTRFPDPASRSWRWIRDAIYERFEADGVPGDVIEKALGPVGDVYKRLRDSPRIDMTDPDKGVEAVEHWVQTLVIGLLIEVAQREVDLVQAGLRA